MSGFRSRLRQMFCRHEYEPRMLHGFLVVDGWLERPEVLVCRRCGKRIDPGSRRRMLS